MNGATTYVERYHVIERDVPILSRDCHVIVIPSKILAYINNTCISQ